MELVAASASTEAVQVTALPLELCPNTWRNASVQHAASKQPPPLGGVVVNELVPWRCLPPQRRTRIAMNQFDNTHTHTQHDSHTHTGTHAQQLFVLLHKIESCRQHFVAHLKILASDRKATTIADDDGGEMVFGQIAQICHAYMTINSTIVACCFSFSSL